jgi:predicted acetyltransferase
MSIVYEPLGEAASHLDGAARAASLSFGQPVATIRSWFTDNAGLHNVRVAGVRGGSFDPSRGAERVPEGCLFRIPMGQFFGGRIVPMMGVAGVVVAPEARGRGLARDMMSASLREARADGFALATLNASTLSLYRKVGFELAGHVFRTVVPLRPDRPLGPRDAKPALRVVPLASEVTPALVECQRAFASCHDGMVDRGPYCWGRAFHLRGQSYDGFGLVNEKGKLEAYAFLAQRYPPGSAFVAELTVNDVAWTTPRAARALVAFLSDYATISHTMAVRGGPYHPIFAFLPQHEGTVERIEHWLLRVVDVERALTDRGYRVGVAARVALEIDDAIVPENTGTYVIDVAHGRARVTRGGDAPRVKLDVRALGALYTGFVSAEQARQVGALEGGDDAVGLLSSIFSGTTPAMTDLF